MPKTIKTVELTRNSDSLYTQIVDYWREKISTGVLKDGDALPPERELAEMFDVSRVPVREALKVLEYLGIVKQVRGKGVFVQKADPRAVFGTVGPMLTATSEVLSDLFDIRILLEPYAAQQAAELRTEEDLQLLRDGIAGMQMQISTQEYAEKTSFSFHMVIINASRNKVLIMLSYFLSELQRQSRHKTLWNQQRIEEALHFHQVIYEKIESRDGIGAFETMKEHLEQAKQTAIR